MGHLPVRRFGGRQLMAQHVGHFGAALRRLDVPGEGHKIAPMTVVQEHRCGAVDAACRYRFAKTGQKRRNLIGRRGVEDGFSASNSPTGRVAHFRYLTQRQSQVEIKFPRCSAPLIDRHRTPDFTLSRPAARQPGGPNAR